MLSSITSSEEIEPIVQFLIACDVADFGEPDTDEGDLREQWQEMDLARDAWVLRDGDAVQGYAAISGKGGKRTLDLYAHETLTPIGGAKQLAQATYRRAAEITAEQSGTITVTAFASYSNSEVNDALLKSGFTEVTRHYRMQFDFAAPLADVDWPGGFRVISYQPEYEQELYDLIEVAFDWPGHVMPPLPDWRTHLFRGGRYDPDYFVLLLHEGKLVGAALSYNEDPYGWIRQLAVLPSLRGLGLGVRLLRHMFYLFQQAGRSGVGLGVEAENPNAILFYERQGMRRAREFVEYQKKFGV